MVPCKTLHSKWDNIKLSDDEDDVHPNIDRESWFRMKHRSRVDHEEREEDDKKKIDDEVRKMKYGRFYLGTVLYKERERDRERGSNYNEQIVRPHFHLLPSFV